MSIAGAATESLRDEDEIDAHLVHAALAGDQTAFLSIYDRYSAALYDFSASILRDRHEAQDVVQEVFATAAKKMVQLRDATKLRPWLYAIARHDAVKRSQARRREQPVSVLPEQTMSDEDAGLLAGVTKAELRDLVNAALMGLTERDRALVSLHLRQGLEGQQLALAMGVTVSHVHVLLQRARESLERSLAATVLARHSTSECPVLAQLVEDSDGQMTPLLRKRIVRHLDKCALCGEQRRRLVNPAALLAALPFLPAPVLLRQRVHQSAELVAHTSCLGAAGTEASRPAAGSPSEHSWWPPPLIGHLGQLAAGAVRAGDRTSRTGLAAIVIVTLGLSAWSAGALGDPDDVSGTSAVPALAPTPPTLIPPAPDTSPTSPFGGVPPSSAPGPAVPTSAGGETRAPTRPPVPGVPNGAGTVRAPGSAGPGPAPGGGGTGTAGSPAGGGAGVGNNGGGGDGGEGDGGGDDGGDGTPAAPPPEPDGGNGGDGGDGGSLAPPPSSANPE